MQRNTDPVLDVENLSFGYGKNTIWKGINLRLEAGSIAFLVGPNGAGKSSLLRCLAGWSSVRDGRILLQGQPLKGSNRLQRSAMVFVPDTPPFYDDLTAIEHLHFVLRANRRSEDEDYGQHLLDAFGLSRFGDQFPSSFSRGMREKLALTLALSLRPDLLMLDEPYGPLDREASLTLSSELNVVAKSGTAILLSCHHAIPALDPHVVFQLKDGHLCVDTSVDDSDSQTTKSTPKSDDTSPLPEDGEGRGQ